MFLQLIMILLTASTLWAGPSPVKIDGGDTVTPKIDTTVSTTATLIAASNSSRAALNCTSSAAVRWGSSLVNSTMGQQIPAGGSVEIRNTAAVYMAAESDSSTVSCTEETYAASTGTGVFSP